MINNKYRFWTGIGLFGGEVLLGLIFALSLVDYSFIDGAFVFTAIFIVYNIFAAILIFSGSKKENGDEYY